MYALAFVATVSVRFWSKERPRNGISRFGRPRLVRNRTETLATQAIYAPNSFATLETRRELEPKCIPQVFLGSLLGMRRSAIGLFSPNVPSNSSRSLCEIYGDSTQFFGGYHPTLKLSGIPIFTFIVSLTHRMDNI